MRGGAGGGPVLLWGKEKCRSPALPSARGGARRRRGPGCTLAWAVADFLDCFHGGSVWCPIWLNDARVGDHAGGGGAQPRNFASRVLGLTCCVRRAWRRARGVPGVCVRRAGSWQSLRSANKPKHICRPFLGLCSSLGNRRRRTRGGGAHMTEGCWQCDSLPFPAQKRFFPK